MRTGAQTTKAQSAAPAHSAKPRFESDGRRRAVIENIKPCVDGGRFPAKRIVGESADVEADVFTDGHDLVSAVLQYRDLGASAWKETPMRLRVNDRWVGRFVPATMGLHEFRVVAWVDRFKTWRHDLEKRAKAGQELSTELAIGAGLVDQAARRCEGDDRRTLAELARRLRSGAIALAERTTLGLSEELAALMARHADRTFAVESSPVLRVFADRPKARFSTWYELFPRSTSPDPKRHGTFGDVEARLPDIAGMGFDVLYLPPIHPIGRAFRKGKNNTTNALPDDSGSPWAIGSAEGGHKSIHPELGTMQDFERLVAAADAHGIEIALDIAYQCSPDHPYVREHPEWFRKRPDGTIQYAENPPKKYQDIYPFDFECEAWESLWAELRDVVLFWVGHGVKIFRVDNPHTKAFPFWEWMIAEVKREHPEVLFLSEAFTRPKVMYRLAKLGFTQSYTYFTWRNQPWEIEQYFTELTRTDAVDFFRPNAWPNTPDILHEYLQHGGRPAAMARLVLAATLCANYGMYGPPFELVEFTPREPGSEEYRDSEKYQRRVWDLARPGNLREFISRVNRIRRENIALQQDRTLFFHRVDNPSLVCYSKCRGDNLLLCVVNTDPHHTQWGTVDLNLDVLGLRPDQPYQVHDLLTDARYSWSGWKNVVGLDPHVCPAHVLRVGRHERDETEFEYFL